MNAEALLVIGILVLVLGLPLFAIGWWVARWIHRKHPDSNATTRRITKAGALLYGSLTVAWLAGLIWASAHPSGLLNKVLTYGGIEGLVIVIGAPFLAAGLYLESRGIKFISTKEDRA